LLRLARMRRDVLLADRESLLEPGRLPALDQVRHRLAILRQFRRHPRIGGETLDLLLSGGAGGVPFLLADRGLLRLRLLIEETETRREALHQPDPLLSR
jgi:hypothetical protein